VIVPRLCEKRPRLRSINGATQRSKSEKRCSVQLTFVLLNELPTERRTQLVRLAFIFYVLIPFKRLLARLRFKD